MLTKILLLTCLFAIPYSAYTYELLSSKTTLSPGCEGGVLEHITDSYSLLSNDSNTLRELRAKTFLGASTQVTVFSAMGNTTELITLQSNHRFSIQNSINKSQNLKFSVKLFTPDRKYTINTYAYRLAPQEAINDSITLYFNKHYAKPGSYKVYAYTTLSGDTHSSARDSNHVTIR